MSQSPLSVASGQRSSFNWHGSVPTARADEAFTPNFRQFDFYLEPETPNSELVDRVFKTKEGQEDWQLNVLFGGQVRAVPLVLSSLGPAIVCNWMFTNMMAKNPTIMRWSFYHWWAITIASGNVTKWYGRERNFYRDWQRNQSYAYDESRQQRDKQRVREALYEKNFVTNPLAEYRIKQWEVSERFA